MRTQTIEFYSVLIRYMKATFEKAVAMFNVMGSPDLFITFTGNPAWLKDYCTNGLSWADNADIAVRVYCISGLYPSSPGLQPEAEASSQPPLRQADLRQGL